MEASPEGRERLSREIRMRIAELQTTYNWLSKMTYNGTMLSAGTISRYARGLFRYVEPATLAWFDSTLEWPTGRAASMLDDEAWTEREPIMTGDSELDAELSAIMACVDALDGLPGSVARRVLTYLVRRYSSATG